jgi:dipeptidyl aminopeptidase/acylaminoacyl peptidase
MYKSWALILASLFGLSFCVGKADPPPAADAGKDGRILIWKEGKDILLTPEGKQVSDAASDRKKYVLLSPEGKRVEIPFPDKAVLSDPCISPDGKRVAFVQVVQILGEGGLVERIRSAYVRDVEGKGDGTKFEILAQNITWTSDGKLLAVEAASMKDVRDRKFTTWLVDVGTKEKTKIDLPEGAQVFAATPDGKSFIAVTFDATEKKQHLSSISRDGKKVTDLTEIRLSNIGGLPASRPRLSPDGTHILFADMDREEKLPEGMTRFPRLYFYDLKTQKRERLVDVPLDAFVWDFAWSPDSRHVAFIWKRMEPGVPLASSIDKKGNIVDKDGKPDPKAMTETETHLNVADFNGKNSKTILSAKAPVGPQVTLMKLDWR